MCNVFFMPYDYAIEVWQYCEPTRTSAAHRVGWCRRAAMGAAGGIAASGVPADQRIKAMVVYEPGLEYPFDASGIAIPYLIMGGSQSRYGLAIRALFAETVLALPRIYVLNPSATHLSYVTGMCAEIRRCSGALAR
jgi:predicted dienelactone hydrolase